MPIQYGNKNVDDRFSPLVEPNLYDASVLVDGETFTSKYKLDSAGQIIVHKLGKGTVGNGLKFSHEDVADALITITRDERYNQSREIYESQEAATFFATAEGELATAVETISESWQATAIAKLVAEAGETSAATTTAITKGNVYETIINDRAILAGNKAKPNVLLVSPAVYAAALQAEIIVANQVLGAGEVRSGVITSLGGMIMKEFSGFAANVDYVMYDYRAFSIVPLVETVRVKEAIDFSGNYAQVNIVSGTKVTNPEMALVKKNA